MATPAGASPSPIAPAPQASNPRAAAAPAAAQASAGPARPLAVGTLAYRRLDNARLVMFRDYNSGTRYSRFIRNVVLPAKATIPFNADSRSSEPEKFHATSYTLTCDGTPGSTVTPAAASSRAAFDADLSAVADGWHLFDIVPSEGAETPVPYWMYVKKGASPAPSEGWAPTQTGSFGHQREDGWVAKWGCVPDRLNATGWPLAPRAPVDFNHAADRKDLFRRDIAPCINGDPPYLHRVEPGLMTCLGTHGYAWGTLTAKLPAVVLRDGPRGVGTLVGVTHVEVGTASPAGKGPRRNLYFTDSWRIGKVKPDGTVITLAGYRHTLGGLELVGDWSAIPPERRGFHELWGLAWDSRTFPIDEHTQPIASEGNEKPHVTGVVAFVADTQNIRICKLEFDPRSHAAPPKITEMITGMADPWDVVYHDGQLLISERLRHRVVAHDATTGAYVRTVIEGQPMATLDRFRT
jgi:hypothetical protein